MQAFVEGALSPAALESLSLHLDGCEECRAVVGMVQPVAIDGAGHGDAIGRYVLRRVIGQGGMGVAYEAVDPELHRVVAVKVLQSKLEGHQDRLLLEAQAMAKLTHPNVVTVHDVGREGDRVFIVMALVDGANLRQWLAAQPRTIEQIVLAFERAGDGLIAAHAQGLVHRDFKPENVFVGKDERVWVGDFGLAMAADPAGQGGGAVEGSLAYMAPEQREGGAVDARSDQFSFCVALGEAAKAAPRTPRWLGRIVERGTRANPDARFPTMRAVVDALQKGRRGVRGERVVVAAVLVALVGLASVAAWSNARERARIATCRATDDEALAAWSTDVRERTAALFLATESPLAEATWRSVGSTLDAYATAWRDGHARMCQASVEPSHPGYTATLQREACLNERLRVLRSIATGLQRVDAPMLEQVPNMLQLLPRVNLCDDARALGDGAPLPRAEQTAQVDDVRHRLALATTILAAGRYQEGLELATEAHRDAQAIGHLPLVADAWLTLGTAHGRLGHAPESESALHQAVSAASAGHATTALVRAWIGLMHFAGYDSRKYDDGVRYGTYARTVLDGMPEAFELDAERLLWSRAILVERKRFDEALAISRSELALVETHFGPSHRSTAAALDGFAGILAGQCKPREALDPQLRSCRILEQEFGTPHPQVALCLGNLASLHAQLGEHTLALPLKRRALAMFAEVPGHPNHVAMAHRNMARSLLELGRAADASKELDDAARANPRASEEVATLVLRGEVARRQGRLEEALTLHRTAVRGIETSETPRRIEPLVALAETELRAGQAEASVLHAAEALKLAEAIYGRASCKLADARRVLAEGQSAVGSPREAITTTAPPSSDDGERSK